MTVDFTKPVLYDSANKGYMVTMFEVQPATNEGPNYEVLEGYPNWPDVQAWLAAGGKAELYVPLVADPKQTARYRRKQYRKVMAK